MLYFGQSLASVVTTCLTSRPAETVSRSVRKAGVTLNKYSPVRSPVKPVVSCHQRQRSCQAAVSELRNSCMDVFVGEERVSDGYSSWGGCLCLAHLRASFIH